MRTFLLKLCLLFSFGNAIAEGSNYGLVNLYGVTTEPHLAQTEKTEDYIPRTRILSTLYSRQFAGLRFDHEKICGGFSYNVWGVARHLNTKHQFNERNGGFGGRYYHCKLPEGMYFTFFRLKNSLSGLTYGFGLGFENELVSIPFLDERLSLGAGVDTNYLNYGVPRMCILTNCRDQFNVEGALPMPFLTVGTTGMKLVLHRLVPNKQIYLWGLLIKHDF